MVPPLQQRPTFPTDQAFVLRLHQHADPRAGRISGRIEHITSGNYTDFSSAAQLAEMLIGLAIASGCGGAATRRQQDPNETVS